MSPQSHCTSATAPRHTSYMARAVHASSGKCHGQKIRRHQKTHKFQNLIQGPAAVSRLARKLAARQAKRRR